MRRGETEKEGGFPSVGDCDCPLGSASRIIRVPDAKRIAPYIALGESPAQSSSRSRYGAGLLAVER